MKALAFVLTVASLALVSFASAAEPQGEAIRKDRKLIEGTWRITALEISGNSAKPEDARKLVVINGPDNAWSLLSEGQVVAKGTNAFDPTKQPKTIEFIVTEGGGNGNKFHGIYELGEKTRRLCFAPADKPRPTEFQSTTGSDNILVTFEREMKKP